VDEEEAATPHVEVPTGHVHAVDDAILAALDTYVDPILALTSLQPESAAKLLEPRLIDVFGSPKPVWMVEGDKLRLRRDGKKFMDITDHQDLYLDPVTSLSGKASTHGSLL
jgi:leucyl aminopeptidase